MKINRQSKGEITMKLSQITLSFCFLLLIAGNAFPQKVNVGFNKGTDFSKYKTFA